jgi:hypothetical protein
MRRDKRRDALARAPPISPTIKPPSELKVAPAPNTKMTMTMTVQYRVSRPLRVGCNFVYIHSERDKRKKRRKEKKKKIVFISSSLHSLSTG